MKADASFPKEIVVFERGWLSSNNVLLTGPAGSTLVDTGYVTHAGQTLDLVRKALGDDSLSAVLNTHLHSDHCGGNAALARAFPAMRIGIPPGLASAVTVWDREALTYGPTGQNCDPFGFDFVLRPGMEIGAGIGNWEVHAAPGHDPHSVILFEPASRVLISADALWEHGFGVVFPELEGVSAFDEVADTLDLIESLDPRWIIPGHGAVFSGERLPAALETARSRLDSFIADPRRHARHAAKVLLKFKLLEAQELRLAELSQWAQTTRYFEMVHGRYFENEARDPWISALVGELVRGNVARVVGDRIINC